MKTQIILAVLFSLLVSSCYSETYYDELESISDELEEAGLAMAKKPTNPFLPGTAPYIDYQAEDEAANKLRKKLYDFSSVPITKREKGEAPLREKGNYAMKEKDSRRRLTTKAIEYFSASGIYDADDYDRKSKEIKVNDRELYDFLEEHGSNLIGAVGTYVGHEKSKKQLLEDENAQSFINPKYFEEEQKGGGRGGETEKEAKARKHRDWLWTTDNNPWEASRRGKTRTEYAEHRKKIDGSYPDWHHPELYAPEESAKPPTKAIAKPRSGEPITPPDLSIGGAIQSRHNKSE